MFNSKSIYFCVTVIVVITGQPPGPGPPPGPSPASVVPRQEDVKQLHADAFNGYDKNLLPLEVFDKPVTINISVNVVSLNSFDDISGELDMTATLNIYWNEERINWDSQNYSNINTIIVPYETIWTPQIFLANTVKVMSQLGKEGVMVRVANTGLVSWNPGQILKCLCSPNVKYYPFDIQECQLMFITWSYVASEINLQDPSKQLNMTFYALNSQWEFLDSSYSSGMIKDRIFIQYNFKLKRRSQFFVVYIICPIIFLGILNGLVFAMPVSSGERISVAITAFLAYAVYMGIINENVPNNSDPMATIFIYLLFLMSQSSLTMMLAVVSLRIYDKEGPVSNPVKIVVEFLHLKYFSAKFWRNRRVSTITDEAIDVNGKTVSINRDVYKTKKHKLDEEEITWKTVGKTFDAFFFVFGVLLHSGFTFGFFYAIAVNEFPDV